MFEGYFLNFFLWVPIYYTVIIQLLLFKQINQMKSVSKKTKIPSNQDLYQNDSFSPTFFNAQSSQLPQEQMMRRYSQQPPQHIQLVKKPNSRQSRMTNFKSQHQVNKKSAASKSKLSNNKSQIQIRYRQIQDILNKKNQTLQLQNQFLKQQIRKLYERETKYKQAIQKYRAQVKFLAMQNEVYQGRYQQLKAYVSEVIKRIPSSDDSNSSEIMQNCSKDLVNKLKQQLYYDDANQKTLHKTQQPAFNDPFKNYIDNDNEQDLKIHSNQRILVNLENQDATKKFLAHQQYQDQQLEDTDLQQTRFISKQANFQNQQYQNQYANQPDIYLKPYFQHRSKGLPPLYPLNSPQQSNYQSSTPSNQNSECKTIDRVIKNKRFLHDTSQSNSPHVVNQQIQQLTDQSEALMYELRKTGNQDKEIKKKIIRISQKIRQLKMDKNRDDGRFTSLQEIVQKP